MFDVSISSLLEKYDWSDHSLLSINLKKLTMWLQLQAELLIT